MTEDVAPATYSERAEKGVAPVNAGRNSDGTFAPGSRHNPAGKPKGARHKATRMLERMMQEDAEAVMRAVIDAARNGDTAAARMIIDRVAPARKDAPIDYPLPKVENAKDATEALSAVIEAVSEGELTPGEGREVARLLEGYARLTELSVLEARIAALEAAGK